MSQLSLTEGNVRRALSRFAIPFLGASLLQFLYGAVDLIVVGQFADQAGIAAVSTGSQVMQAVTNFIIGLSTGGTVLVGQYLGARRGEDVNRAIGTLVSLFALIAVVLAAAFALSTNTIVALMQVPAAAAPARQYLFICACGLVFITGYNMVSGVLRGLGDAGNTVVVMEHNLDWIKTADHIIDLGPEGGNRGGTIVAQGTPEQVAQVAESYTGQYLRPLLGK